MAKAKLRIAVVGAGLGSPATAALLQDAGYEVKVYEQSPGFSRIGAGINLSPNVMRVLDRIGVGQPLAKKGARSENWVSREWDTGELLLDYPLGEEAEKRYGAPYMCVHRGDFHQLLINRVAPGTIEFGKRLVGFEQDGAVVTLAGLFSANALLDGVGALARLGAPSGLSLDGSGSPVFCDGLHVRRYDAGSGADVAVDTTPAPRGVEKLFYAFRRRFTTPAPGAPASDLAVVDEDCEPDACEPTPITGGTIDGVIIDGGTF